MYLKEQNPKIAIGCADPLGAAMYNLFKNGEAVASEGGSISEGIGLGRVTPIIEDITVEHPYMISDEEVETFSEIWSGLGPQLWLDPSLIGWIKQFFHIEDLERAICRGKSIEPRRLSVATQLFTPRWIARFLIENTLGKSWLRTGRELPAKANWPLLIRDTQDPQAQTQARSSAADSVESWMSQTFCDPACGAGHLLTV